MKTNRDKTEYICVNESKTGGVMMKLQGEQVVKVEEFKYPGSTIQSNGQVHKRGEEKCAEDAPLLVIINGQD